MATHAIIMDNSYTDTRRKFMIYLCRPVVYSVQNTGCIINKMNEAYASGVKCLHYYFLYTF